MNLETLLKSYRNYELHCISIKTHPYSFRQWVYDTQDLPNLTMEGLVEVLVEFMKVYDSQDEYDGYTEVYDSIENLTREMEI